MLDDAKQVEDESTWILDIFKLDKLRCGKVRWDTAVTQQAIQ